MKRIFPAVIVVAITTLGMFASVGLREFDGTPKSALEVWDSFRE